MSPSLGREYQASEGSSLGSSYGLHEPADSSDAESSSGTGEVTEREISSSSDEDVPEVSGPVSGSSRGWRINDLSPRSSGQGSMAGVTDEAVPQVLSHSEVRPHCERMLRTARTRFPISEILLQLLHKESTDLLH